MPLFFYKCVPLLFLIMYTNLIINLLEVFLIKSKRKYNNHKFDCTEKYQLILKTKE